VIRILLKKIKNDIEVLFQKNFEEKKKKRNKSKSDISGQKFRRQ